MTLTEQFILTLNQGYDCLVQAGQIAVRLTLAWPQWPEYACSRSDVLTLQRITDLLAVGRKEIHPETLLSAKPGVQRLKRCPYAVQEQYLKGEPVELVIETPRGVEVIPTDVHHPTPLQSRRAIGRAVRTPPGATAVAG